jgi:hypothetical protein
MSKKKQRGNTVGGLKPGDTSISQLPLNDGYSLNKFITEK